MFQPNPNDALNLDAQRLIQGLSVTPLPIMPGKLIQLRQFKGNDVTYTEQIQHSEMLPNGTVVIFTHLVNPIGQVVAGTHWRDYDIQAAIAD